MLSTDWTDGRTDGTTRRSAESDVKFHPEEQRGKKMCVGRMEGRKGRETISRGKYLQSRSMSSKLFIVGIHFKLKLSKSKDRQ